MTRSAGWVACVCALAATKAWAADPIDPAKARSAQNAGVRAYEDGRFEDAVEGFSAAYRAQPQAALLLSIARSRYRLKQLDAAKSCLYDFLRDDPNGVNGSEAFDLLTRIEKETPQGKKLSLPCLSPTQVPIDTARAAKAKEPAAPAPPVSAPAVASALAKDQTRPASTVPAPPAPPSGAWTPKPPIAGATAGQKTSSVSKHGPWSYAAIGASVVAAGAGAYFGAKNLSATSDWRAARTAQDSAAARDRSQSAARSANIAWAASGVLAATGLGLFFFTQF